MTDNIRSDEDSVRTQKLSDRSVKALPVPQHGQSTLYDSELPGFGVRVTSTGTKSFILRYRVKGVQKLITIGRYPTWTLVAARLRAQEFRRMADSGIDPLEHRQEARSAPIMRDLFERYERDHLPKLSSSMRKDVKRVFVKRILPQIGAKKVADVTYSDVERLHRDYSKTAPTAANRMIASLRKAFNLAIKWKWIDHNPASGIEQNTENQRRRFLSAEELARLMRALDQQPEKTSADAIKFIAATGCRKGEALKASWDQFNGDYTIWDKPAALTKQKRQHRVVISSYASELLRARRWESTYWVFEGRTDGHLTDVKRTWAAACKEASLEGVRIHDLRHTFASMVVSTGHSLQTAGALLGHQQYSTTLRYAHLDDLPQHLAAEEVGKALLRANYEFRTARPTKKSQSIDTES